MGQYRAVVRNVRYWRGAPKTWSCSYEFTGTLSGTLGTSDAQAVFNAHSKLCYNAGSTNGGPYRCDIYDQNAGGIAIASYVAFDPSVVANWAPPPGSVWGGVPGTTVNEPAEGALLVEWAGGLSSSGKPVKFKKFIHQAKGVASAAGAPDVSASDVTALTAAANAVTGTLGSKGLTLGVGGRLAGAASVKNYYVNHQLVRGRRRRVTSAAAVTSFGSRVLQLAENEAYSNTK